MAKPAYGRKNRNKLVVALLSPILIVVFMFGWVLYFIGQSERPKIRQPQKPIDKMPSPKKEVEFMVIPNEEAQIMAK